MRLDSAGNLGLGVTPSAWDAGAMKALQVVGANFVGDTTGVYRARVVANGYFNGGWKYQQTNCATQYVQNGADGTHAWFTAPSGTAGNAISFTQAMDLANSGGASTLSVNSALNTASAIRLTTNGGLTAGMFLAAPSVDHSLGFQTAGTEKMRITSAGNVGIGTTSPDYNLDVESTTNPTVRVRSNGGTVGNYAELLLETYNSFSGVGKSYVRGVSSASGNSNTDLVFGVNASGFGAPYEAMRIDSSGNVGVGTSSPAAKLHVVSGAIEPFRLGSTSSGYNYITHLNYSAGVVGYIGDGLSAVTGYSATDYAIRANQGNLLFATNGNNVRAIIDTSGNLGLGVTPSAWTSTLKAIEVGYLGSSVYSGGQADMNMTSNAYFNSGWKYGGTGGASKISLSENSFALSIAPSGTAGNAITFTQAMTLDANGHFMVGATASGGTGVTVYPSGIIRVNASIGTLVQYQYASSQVGSVNTDGIDLSLNAQSALVFGTNGTTERMRIDSSGNVGIGTSSGGYKLTVAQGNAVVVTGSADGTSGFALFDAVSGGNHIGSMTRQGNGIDVASYDQISFKTGATSGISSGAERMRITSAGNVGISKVYYRNTYPESFGIEFLEKSNIDVEQI